MYGTLEANSWDALHRTLYCFDFEAEEHKIVSKHAG